VAAGVILAAGQHPIVPVQPPADMAVAANFERFTGTNPALDNAPQNAAVEGSPNRPGGFWKDGTVYTRGRVGGLTNVLGAGQAAMPEGGQAGDLIYRAPGKATFVNAPTIQLRMGVGQHGPSSLGLAQTVALATITNNPPAGVDLLRILSGQG